MMRRYSLPFDVNTLPVSDVALGEFVYLTLHAGYTLEALAERTRMRRRISRASPFWVGTKNQWIEGRLYHAAFAAERGRNLSESEISKSFDDAIGLLGGARIGEGVIAAEAVKIWGPEITVGFKLGIDPARFKYPVATSSVWLIRRNDGNIWVFLTTNQKRGRYVIGNEAAYTQTSELISAPTLKQAIDAKGKVVVQLYFVTDKADILLDSQSQIDQVVKLLRDDVELKLAINEHTDNAGNKFHNQALSEGRARSVVAALVAKGIAPNIRAAAGFGDTQPESDNGSEEDMASNRRVEPVKVLDRKKTSQNGVIQKRCQGY